MRDLDLLQNELVQCESELASITKDDHIDTDVYSYVNYIDPIRAQFLKDKISFILMQIEINGN